MSKSQAVFRGECGSVKAAKCLISVALIFTGFISRDLFAGSPALPETASIEVQITQLQSPDGQLLVNLYATGEGFPAQPEKAFKRAFVAANNPHYIFNDIPIGAYALAVCHDENGNGICDLNFFGIPKEGVGASNNEIGFHGPPKFKNALFQVVPNYNKVTISLNY